MVSDLLLASTISTKLKLLNHFQWKYLYVYQEFCRDWQIWYLTKIFCFEKEGRKKQPMVWVVKSCHQATEINLEKKEKTKFLSVNNRGKPISYSALQFLRVLCKSIISSQSKFSLWWRNKINHITLSNYFRFKPRGVFRTLSNIKDVVTAFYIFSS